MVKRTTSPVACGVARSALAARIPLATAMAASASTTGSRSRPAHPLPALPAERDAAEIRVLAVSVACSASANCAAVAKRSAGSFSSAVRTAPSTAGGTVSRCG